MINMILLRVYSSICYELVSWGKVVVSPSCSDLVSRMIFSENDKQ